MPRRNVVNPDFRDRDAGAQREKNVRGVWRFLKFALYSANWHGQKARVRPCLHHSSINPFKPLLIDDEKYASPPRSCKWKKLIAPEPELNTGARPPAWQRSHPWYPLHRFSGSARNFVAQVAPVGFLKLCQY